MYNKLRIWFEISILGATKLIIEFINFNYFFYNLIRNCNTWGFHCDSAIGSNFYLPIKKDSINRLKSIKKMCNLFWSS